MHWINPQNMTSLDIVLGVFTIKFNTLSFKFWTQIIVCNQFKLLQNLDSSF